MAVAIVAICPPAVSAGALDHPQSPKPAAASSGAPALPATGRLHTLASPRRVASSRTGLRLPARPVAPHSVHRIAIAGVDGLPRSGLRAVAVVVTAVAPTGATAVRLGSASTAPVLTTARGTSSAFAIVPVGSGALVLRNGNHPAHISIDVVGWFSSSNEKSTAGLFKPLAGRTLTSVVIGAGRTRSVKLRGLHDVPAIGVGAVLLRSIVSAAHAGSMTVAPNAAAARSTTSLVHPAGRSTDLTLVRVSSAGTALIRNAGHHAITVTLASVGWFTDGRDSTAHGDTLRLATPSTVLAAGVGTAGRSLTVCGRAGIPAATSTRPASFVLARATATAPRSTQVQIDPAGATPTRLPAVLARAGVALSRLTLLPPSASCRVRLSTSSGQSRVSLQTYGWFGGGTVLRPNLRILDSAMLARIRAVTTDSITFAGSTPTLHTKDVVAAGISPTTPVGLLRTITSMSTAGGRTTVHTTPAGLGDAVVEGSMSAGHALSVSSRPAARAPRSAARRESPCGVTGSVSDLSVEVSCSHTFGDGVFTAQVDASAAVSLTLGMDIAWGLVPKVDVHATLAFDAHASAQVTATAQKTLDETLPLGHRRLAPIDVQLGPVPVVIQPEIDANLELTGTLGATFTASASADASASLTFDSKTGFRPQHSFDGNASSSVKKKIQADVKASFNPTVQADLYGLGSSNISVGISPFVEADADACTLRAKAGIDAHLGLSLGINHALRVAKSFTFPGVRKTLLAKPWRNCAVWSGTMTAKFLAHYLDDQGHKTGDVKASATVTLKAPPQGEPPEDGDYMFTGFGSGSQIARQYGCNDNPDALFATQQKSWGDDMRHIDGQGFRFTPGASGITVVEGSVDASYEVRTADNVFCPTRTSDSSTAVEASPIAFDIIWNTPYGPKTPAGQMTFMGTQTRQNVPDGNGSTETRTFTWSLTKRCTLGGNQC